MAPSMVPIALAMALFGCGGSSTWKVDTGVDEVRDSGPGADLGIDASADGELGAGPLDAAGEAQRSGRPDGGSGEPAVVDGAIVDEVGRETSAEYDASEADRPGPEAGATAPNADAMPGAETDRGAMGEAGPAADVREPALDVSALGVIGADAGSDSPSATDAADTASRVDFGRPDSDGISGALPRIWVYLMAGQSNMLGQAYTAELATADAQPIPNAEIYFVSPLETNPHMKAWLPVAPGFGWHDDQFGPEVGFARRYHALYPDRRLALIKVTQGATELFDRWKAPTGSLYQLLTQTVLEQMQVLATRGRPELAGFFWMQGESDGTVLEHANAYRDNLLSLIQHLRVDLALATMPAVAGLIATGCCWPYADTIRKSTTQVSAMVGNMGVVETDDLPMSKKDIGHYSATGQIELGLRFAHTAANLLGTQWKFPDRLGAVQSDACFTYRERTGSDATPMTFDSAQAAWRGSAGASIGKGGMTPGATTLAELAWSAPFAGTFQVTVSVTVPDRASAGAQIEVSDGNRALWGPWSVGPGQSITAILPRDMEQKDPLYFRTSAGARWNPSQDATSWQIDIDAKSVSNSWIAPP